MSRFIQEGVHEAVLMCFTPLGASPACSRPRRSPVWAGGAPVPGGEGQPRARPALRLRHTARPLVAAPLPHPTCQLHLQ